MGYPRPQDRHTPEEPYENKKKSKRPHFMTQEFKESLPICNTCKIQNSCALYKFAIKSAKISDGISGTNKEIIDTDQNFGCNWHSEHTDKD